MVDVIPLQTGPLPVAALGPIQAELRLANGKCVTKGCDEGKNNRQNMVGASVFKTALCNFSTAAIYSIKKYRN